MAILPLHAQFDIIRLKCHLRNHPEDAYELAVGHYQDYLEVVEQYKQLLAENKKLKSVSLPPFGTPSHGQLQSQYDDLLECYKDLLQKFLNLGEENKALYELLREENPELPRSLRRRRKK